MRISSELQEFLDDTYVQELINNNMWDNVFNLAMDSGVEYELKECIEAANIAEAKDSMRNIEDIRFEKWQDDPDAAFTDDDFLNELHNIRSLILGPGDAFQKIRKVNAQTYTEIIRWELDDGTTLAEWDVDEEIEMIINALENSSNKEEFEKDMEEYYREILEDK